MARLFFSGLRVRLLLLVLLAVIPALGLTLYTNLEERQLRRALVQEHALRLSRIVSADHERLIEDARRLIVALARLPAVRDRNRAACNALFAELLTRHSSYANLGVIDADGNVVCSGLPMTGQVYAGDRAYFRRARETRDFAIGDYQIGRITGKATLNFGQPILDDAGHVRAVVFAALDLAWLSELASRAGLPTGSMLTVIDRHGTILSRYPDEGKWVGKLMPEPLVLDAIRAQQGNGTTEAPGADGTPRLFSFAPFGGASQSANAYVSVGIPAAVAFAGADQILARNLALLGLVAGLALVAAWVGGNLFIVRQVQALVGATKRVAAGELGARAGLPHGQGELSQLASAFDQMAESLERAHERRLLEEELRRKNYQLEQQNLAVEEANRLKTEFVSMVSHELRIPLTSIQGYAELLLEDEQIAEAQRESLTIVKNNSDRLLGLINDLLDLSRIEAGRVDLHRRSLDLARLILEVAGSLRPLIDAKRQRLRLDLGDALPAVWADADRVTQILTNLISNAHKYTPVEGSIVVAARRDDGFVRVDVSDSGIGLSPEERAQLFTKYFRAHDRSPEAGGGTGLGLVITRSLIELHGGRITVSSAPGQGSTFSFSLPALEGPA
ncbi:MAG: HAMP domain-containing protein [Deltaproteobacteria bacterium]|nr:HAMP domain-containing protein [Deltaproteobacteria bacterium]